MTPQLELHERLAVLQREHGVEHDLQSIAAMIRKAELKIYGARTGLDAFDARRQARLEDLTSPI